MRKEIRDTRNRQWPFEFRLFTMAFIVAMLLAMGGCSSHSAFSKSFGDQPLWPEQPPFKQAEERFWAQARVRSNLAESHMKLGLHYQKSGRHESAVREFAKAIRLNPQYIEALNGMGISLTSLGECRQAATTFQTALEVAEKSYLYNNFGCSSLICNDPGLAAQLFRRAAELDDDNSRIANNLRLAELRDRLKSEAIAAGKPQGTTPLPPPSVDPVTENEAYEVMPSTHPAADEPPAGRERVVVLEQRTAPDSAGEAAERPEPPASKSRNTDIPSLAAVDMKRIRIPREVSNTTTIDPRWGIEISNGNGINGMAGRSASFFRRQGFAVNRITNADRYTVVDTIIYYREGYLDAAKRLASVIPGEQQFAQMSDLGRRNIRIRVLLGHDLAALKFPKMNENISKETEAKRVVLAAAPEMIRR